MKLDNQAMSKAMHIKAVRKAAEELRLIKHQVAEAEQVAEAAYSMSYDSWSDYQFQTGMADIAVIEASVLYDRERAKVKAFALSA